MSETIDIDLWQEPPCGRPKEAERPLLRWLTARVKALRVALRTGCDPEDVLEGSRAAFWMVRRTLYRLDPWF